MTMRLSTTGAALAALTSVLGLSGALLAHSGMLMAASITLTLLGVAWILTRDRVRVVHSGTLDLVWWVDVPRKTQGAILPGMELHIHVTMRNRARVSLGWTKLTFLTGPGLEIAPLTLIVDPLQTASASSTLHPLAVGRWLVHGAVATFQGPGGIFSWDAYFPAHQAIRILPDAVIRRNRLMPGGLEHDRKGRFQITAPGGDLREIREYRPGDPFKIMAWKPTARRGTPMVREFEYPTRGRLYIVLDISPSMRKGRIGSSKLDCAIQAVADQAASAADAGAPFGYLAVDMDIYHELAEGEGPGQLSRLFVLLSELHTVVEQGFTDSTDQEVVEALGRYLAYQHGLDARASLDDPRALAGTEHAYMKPVLVGWARSCLQSWRETKKDRLPTPRAPVADDPTMSLLRTCCRVRGIILPYRSGGLPENKTRGLATALSRVAVTRTAMTILLVTDLQEVSLSGSLDDVLRLTRRRGHSLRVLVPYSPNLHDRPNDPVNGPLFDLRARREWLSIRDNVAALVRMGFEVHFLDRNGRPMRRGPRSMEPNLAWNAANR